MICIIAEKPSLARNIIAAIDPKMKKYDGYYSNDDYIVTYAFGHLFSLYDIEQYDPSYNEEQKKRWTLDNLPFFPSQFKFGLKKDEGTIKQYKIIRSLVNRDDVNIVVNAGDSDREGEIIVRIILSHALKSQKDIRRLWMPDQTPKTIKKELSIMKADSEYDSLANEGLARTYIDWMFGINLSRYATIKASSLFRVGRVIVPIVRVIYDKEMEIRNFVSRKYYSIISKTTVKGETVELISKREFDIENEEVQKEVLKQAKAFADEYNTHLCKVTNITSEPKIIPSPRLFSLSDLQGVLGKKFKYTMDKSLKIVQSLYEKGFCSYPRTPTSYLAENEKDKFKEIISSFQKLGKNIVFKDNKFIFDDSKIESHSAITPTYKIPHKQDLSEEEQKVYKVIVDRFFAVFAKDPCIVQRTVIDIDLEGIEQFKLRGDVMSSKGWTEFEPRDKKDKFLPLLQVGDTFSPSFKPVLKETKPPKRYTTETLNNFLKNPFKYIKKIKKSEEEEENKDDSLIEDDSEDYKAMFEGVELGTEATRSTIINNAISSKYISLRNNVYYLESGGEFYIDSLEKLKISLPKEKTAQLGRSLKKVYRGEIDISECIDLAKKDIEEVFSYKNITLEGKAIGQVICSCPYCNNGQIKGMKFGYYCTNPECKKGISYDNKYLSSIGVRVSPALVRILMNEGIVKLDNLVSKKTGKRYSAYLEMDYNDKYPKFNMKFNK
ncbi:MAG: DNA topoisomerase [Bacilli bacterium]|nr:DNA topoisomerase [Bacilli bacterium]